MATIDLQGRILLAEQDSHTNLPYDEDALVNLIADIYKAIQRVGDVNDECMAWPPPEGHHLNLSALPAGAQLDPGVVSLLKRLPINLDPGRNVLPGMKAVNFLTDNGIRQSRLIDVRNWEEHLEGDACIFPPPTTIMLFTGEDELTPMLMLDIAENTVRCVRHPIELDDDYTDDDFEQGNVKEHLYDITNWPAMPAPQYLESVLHNLLEAIWIPDPLGGFWSVDSNDMAERQRVLKVDYGWPDNFREADWREKAAELMREDVEELDRQDEAIRAVLSSQS